MPKKKANKLDLRQLTPDERNEIDQKVAELDKEYGGRATAMAEALSKMIGKDVTRHQIIGIKKQKGCIERKKRNELKEGDVRSPKVVQWLWEIMNFDVADFADLYPDHVRDTILKLKREGKPTHLIKEIVMGACAGEEVVKNIKYHDPFKSASKLAQIFGMLKENQGGARVGTLNMYVDTGGDIYDNAMKQLDVIDGEVVDDANRDSA